MKVEGCLQKIERTKAKIVYSNEAPYTASARRVLNDPIKFLGGRLMTLDTWEKCLGQHLMINIKR